MIFQESDPVAFLDLLGFIELGTWSIPWVGLIFTIIFLVFLIILYRIIIRELKKNMKWKINSPGLYNGVRFFLSIGIIIAFIIFAIYFLKIQSEYVLIITGIFLSAILFASMKSVNNFIAGIYLTMVSRPFTVGDYIRIGYVEGIVTEISLNYTKIKHRDASISILPNIMCLTAEIHNFTVSVDWFKRHIKEIERRIDLKKKKSLVKEKATYEFVNQKLEEELSNLREIFDEIEKVQKKFIEMKNDEERRKKENREKRRKKREKNRSKKMEESVASIFGTPEKKNQIEDKTKRRKRKTENNTEENIAPKKYEWPSYSIYVEDDKIVRYTFSLNLPRDPDRNAVILAKVCKEWTDEFEVTPRWVLSGIGGRLTYDFIIMTPDPYDIIHYYDEFVEDVYQEIFDTKK